MIYYRHIEIDNFEVIQSKTLAFIEMQKTTSVGFSILTTQEYTQYCPEVLTAFDRYNIKPVMFALYTTMLQEQSQVHVDSIAVNAPICRINIPILNCEGSKTEFYSGGEYDTFIQQNGIPYLVIKEGSSPTKVDEVEITKPTVIRIKEPHRVNTNMNRTPRICMTIRFDVDPVFLLD